MSNPARGNNLLSQLLLFSCLVLLMPASLGAVLLCVDSTLYAVRDGNVYTVDTANANVTLMGTIGGVDVPTRFDGACLYAAAVPEPAQTAAALGLLVLAGTWFVRRRRT